MTQEEVDEVLDLPSPMKNAQVISEGCLEPIFTILEEKRFGVHVLKYAKSTFAHARKPI